MPFKPRAVERMVGRAGFAIAAAAERPCDFPNWPQLGYHPCSGLISARGTSVGIDGVHSNA